MPYRIIIIPITLFFLIKCSAGINSLYTFDYPLTNEKAYSTLSNISVKIPEGWYQIDDNEYGTISLWLMKNDLSSSLQFSLINLDDAIIKDNPDNSLEKVKEYNKIFVKLKYGNEFTGFFNQEDFEINGKSFKAYQYTNDKNQIIRTVIFIHKEKFYESVAVTNSKNSDFELFTIQNTVLSTLE